MSRALALATKCSTSTPAVNCWASFIKVAVRIVARALKLFFSLLFALVYLFATGVHSQLPEPDWVDWESVRRGQAHWCRLLGPTFLALNAALLQGFSIARFAEVLVLAGYTASATATWNRFRNTGWAILDWFHHPLDDPESEARQALYKVRSCLVFVIGAWPPQSCPDIVTAVRMFGAQVRVLHAYGRRRAMEANLFKKELGEVG